MSAGPPTAKDPGQGPWGRPGSQDRVLTTLALVTGVHAGSATRFTVLVAGLSGALATVSMALGAYVAGQSQRELVETEISRERSQLGADFAWERRELTEILELEGLSSDAAGRVADALSERLRIPYTAGDSPLRQAAIIIGVSFLLGAAVPVLPYFLFPVGSRLFVSVGLALLVLAGIGLGKARVTGG